MSRGPDPRRLRPWQRALASNYISIYLFDSIFCASASFCVSIQRYDVFSFSMLCCSVENKVDNSVRSFILILTHCVRFFHSWSSFCCRLFQLIRPLHSDVSELVLVFWSRSRTKFIRQLEIHKFVLSIVCGRENEQHRRELQRFEARVRWMLQFVVCGEVSAWPHERFGVCAALQNLSTLCEGNSPLHFHDLTSCCDIYSCFFSFLKKQEAMKDQQIEFKEIDTDHLGSEKEYKVPNSPSSSGSSSSSNKSSSKSSNSWRGHYWYSAKQRQFTTAVGCVWKYFDFTQMHLHPRA